MKRLEQTVKDKETLLQALDTEVRSKRIDKHNLEQSITKILLREKEIRKDIEALTKAHNELTKKNVELIKANSEQQKKYQNFLSDIAAERKRISADNLKIEDDRDQNAKDKKKNSEDAIKNKEGEKDNKALELSLNNKILEFTRQKAKENRARKDEEIKLNADREEYKDKLSGLFKKEEELTSNLDKSKLLKEELDKKIAEYQQKTLEAQKLISNNLLSEKQLSEQLEGAKTENAEIAILKENCRMMEISLDRQLKAVEEMNKEAETRNLRILKLARDKGVEKELKELEKQIEEIG